MCPRLRSKGSSTQHKGVTPQVSLTFAPICGAVLYKTAIREGKAFNMWFMEFADSIDHKVMKKWNEAMIFANVLLQNLKVFTRHGAK